MKIRNLIYAVGLLTVSSAIYAASPQQNVAEEVVWMIGDQPIWRSEVEEAYAQMKQEKYPIKGDPYCFVPEQIALERIYLHQADLDTIEVTPSQIAAEVDSRINEWIAQVGSKERLEEYMHKPMPELRQFLTETLTNNYRTSEVQRKLTSKVNSTPAQVRRYFDKLPKDSIPYVPTQVEVQIITLNPAIPKEEIEAVKDRLRGFAEKVNSGETPFSTLAVLYSEDGSAPYGGEIGFRPRAGLATEYANVAFNLTDPKKASKVVETEYGFHIIQLIEKRGDRINTRHILLRPKVSDKDLIEAQQRLDSIRADILDDKFSFEEAATVLSQDKETRNNKGLMTNTNRQSDRYNSSFFEMRELPAEVAKAVADLKPGEVSKAFMMKDPNSAKDIVAVAKLKNRVEAHRADMVNDYQLIKAMCENAERQRILNEWIDKKIANTYIRIEPEWADCPDWRHNWLKK